MQWLSLTPQLRSHVNHYAESHRNPVNKLLHFIGIPFLLLSAMGLLSKISLSADMDVPALHPNAAWIALFGTGIWYLRLGWKMGLLTFLAVTGCYLLGSAFSASLLFGIGGMGVIAHVIGHYGFEHKPPALLSKPVAVLEAPVWLLSTWAGLYR